MRSAKVVLGRVLMGACMGAAATLSAATLDASLFQANANLKVMGYTGMSELADFPVLVRLREGFPTGFTYADAGTDGAGIRFADAEGNLLAHEIDTWNPDGESAVWVKLPSMTKGTTLRVYWKAGESTLPEVTASDVWNKYLVVLHGKDYANSAASGLACSAGSTTSADITSKIGGAAFGIAQNKLGIQIANPILNGKTTTDNGVTFSGWFRPTKLDASGYNIVIASSNPTWNKGGFLALWEAGYFFSVAVGGTHQGTGRTSWRVVAANKWEHMAFSYAGTRLALYEDGNQVWSSATAKPFIDAGQGNWTVGSYTSQTVDSFIGQMDEIRFYNGEASADWLKAEYDAAMDPQFLETVQPVADGAFAAIAYLKAVGYSGAETLVGFPVPVRIRADFPKNFAYADVSDPASDLRFFDTNGNLLPHEVDTWNPEGESLVWVRMDAMPTGGSLFKMGWKRNAQVTLAENVPGEVWTKYLAVLHGDSYANSSASGLECAAGGTTSGDATCKVGGVAYANTQNTLGMQIANPVKNDKTSIKAGVTFSAWFRPTKINASGYNIALACNEISWNKGGFIALWEGGKYVSVACISTHQGKGGSTVAVQPDIWEHIAFSYGDRKLAIYEDGNSVYLNNSAVPLQDPGQDNWVVGSYTQNQLVDSFIGQMDEIRFYRGIASSTWLKAEYDAAIDAGFVAEIDSSTIVRAVWTNAGENGKVSDPANWTCYNAFGDVVANALPSTASTAAQVTGLTSFSVAEGGARNWKTLTLTDVVLTNACDWTAFGVVEYRVEGTLDLNGFDLRTTSLPTTGTITDTEGGSKLILEVPAETVVGSGAAVLTGALKFVKEGAGTYQPSAISQTYIGGTEIRAGIAENGISGVAAYGPAMSVIKVCKGASFDWKGSQDVPYSFDIAGSGFNGKGVLFTTVQGGLSGSWYQVNRIANLTLSDDATLDSSGGYLALMYLNTNPALHEITFNGHTLTLTTSATVWQYRYHLRGVKAMDAGRIVLEKLGGVFYGPASDLSLATFEVLAGDLLTFEISPTIGTFIDHRPTASAAMADNVHQRVFVTTRLVPYATVPTENFCLGTETAKAVTLDLSQLSAPFNLTLATPARAVTFAADTTITIDPGMRLPALGEKSMQVVVWTAVPENVAFVLPPALAKRGYRLDVRETGLYLSCDGMLIIVR